MRLTRVRLTARRMMVSVAILSVALVLAFDILPDVRRRWSNCRVAAEAHASRATYAAGVLEQAAARGEKEEAEFVRAWERIYLNELRLSRKYSRALRYPWQFYSLGDRSLPENDLNDFTN